MLLEAIDLLSTRLQRRAPSHSIVLSPPASSREASVEADFGFGGVSKFSQEEKQVKFACANASWRGNDCLKLAAQRI
jgi:hypothetical protein